MFWWVDQTENTLWDYPESSQRTLWITSPLPQKCSAWKKSSKKYKEKTKMKDNYFLSLSFWLIFHPLWSSGLKCSSKLKMWHLYISRFSTIKRCGFNGFTAENQCFKVIPPATHIRAIFPIYVHKIYSSFCLFLCLIWGLGKLKLWHLNISHFSTTKWCGFKGFTVENQCFKVIQPILFLNFMPEIWIWCIRGPK